MTTFKQTLIDLIAEDTPWYMHVAIWCYLTNTIFLMIMLPPMMGVLLQQAGLGWEVVPDWTGQLYRQTSWMIEFLAGASIIDILQQSTYFIYNKYLKEQDVL